METIKSYQGLIVLVAAFIGIIALALIVNSRPADEQASNRAVAQANTDAEDKKPAQTGQQQNNNAASNRYSYVAQPGDSYSVLARKAVQTYGIVEDVSLSQAQIIAAETQLANNAGFPELNQGQSVKFEQSQVRSAVEAAQKLNAEQKAAWAAYVPHVEFNTNNNGESR